MSFIIPTQIEIKVKDRYHTLNAFVYTLLKQPCQFSISQVEVTRRFVPLGFISES